MAREHFIPDNAVTVLPDGALQHKTLVPGWFRPGNRVTGIFQAPGWAPAAQWQATVTASDLMAGVVTMTRLQRVERELSTGQRRTLADGGSVEITGTTVLAADCSGCLHPMTYWLDPEGIWAECACDGGYLS